MKPCEVCTRKGRLGSRKPLETSVLPSRDCECAMWGRGGGGTKGIVKRVESDHSLSQWICGQSKSRSFKWGQVLLLTRSCRAGRMIHMSPQVKEIQFKDTVSHWWCGVIIWVTIHNFGFAVICLQVQTTKQSHRTLPLQLSLRCIKLFLCLFPITRVNAHIHVPFPGVQL